MALNKTGVVEKIREGKHRFIVTCHVANESWDVIVPPTKNVKDLKVGDTIEFEPIRTKSGWFLFKKQAPPARR